MTSSKHIPGLVQAAFLRRWGLSLGLLFWTAGLAVAQTWSPEVRAIRTSIGPDAAASYVFNPLAGSTNGVVPALALVPGGNFAMGNTYSNFLDIHTNSLEGWSSETPVHAVPVSPFLIAKFETSNEEMARVLQWAYTNGRVAVGSIVVTNVTTAGVTNVVTNLYGTVRNTEGTSYELVDLDAAYCQIAFTNGAFAVAAGKTNFPCIYVTWHGAQAFCNYLSDQARLGRAVDFGPTNWSVDITAAGYRLPTEAEWEKACRGGHPGTHYPWPDDSAQGTNLYLYSIDPVKANYLDARYGSFTHHPMHPWFSEPIRTTPVGYYNGTQVITNLSMPTNSGADFGVVADMANGYGLYDMAGNVYEWCYDYLSTNWYTNSAAMLPDPMGPAAENSFHTQRVFRGGGFTYYSILTGADPSVLRCAIRAGSDPSASATYIGFRAARRIFWVSGVTPAMNAVSLSYWGVSGRVYTVESATNLTLADPWQPYAEFTNTTTGASLIEVDTVANQRALRLKARLAP